MSRQKCGVATRSPPSEVHYDGILRSFPRALYFCRRRPWVRVVVCPRPIRCGTCDRYVSPINQGLPSWEPIMCRNFDCDRIVYPYIVNFITTLGSPSYRTFRRVGVRSRKTVAYSSPIYCKPLVHTTTPNLHTGRFCIHFTLGVTISPPDHPP